MIMLCGAAHERRKANVEDQGWLGKLQRELLGLLAGVFAQAAYVGEMTSDDRAGLARYASAFSAEVMSGAVLAQIATETRCTGSRRQFPGREKPPGKRWRDSAMPSPGPARMSTTCSPASAP